MTDHRKELSVDLYELTMSQVFWRRGMDNAATFSLFFRGYPKDRAYYVAAGIEQALDFLADFHFSAHDIQAIRNTTPLADDFLNALSDICFTGNVRAVPEGTLVFADEPLLEVTAPIIEAQLVETMLLNIVTTASLMATKASRIIQAAAGKPVVDFGSRRTHGEDAAIQAAYSGYIAGFAGTSNVKAAALFRIPAVGTMAHSFIQAFGDETTAFEAYANEFPENTTLLVDTYDTIDGVARAIQVAKNAAQHGVSINAIRLDSGDLGQLANSARKMLDDDGLPDIRIMATGGLDEHSIHALVEAGVPIDAFGVGTRFGTSADAPYIDSVYKLVELDSRSVTKLSPSKVTRPWAKQVYRNFDQGMMGGDIITRESSQIPSSNREPLLRSVMRSGKRNGAPEALTTVRKRVTSNLRQLPVQNRRLVNPDFYSVEYSPELISPQCNHD
ncbi:MAG: nicotinate phosphoribosyltransferase [Chloroflexi bacterium]|nr:nicotinate phosphoribosyltransferase [Chloroflexota bacterium]